MARPRIFIASTVYDLMEVRSGLRHFLESIGYEAVQSEFGGVTYDPRAHTRDSCLREIRSCDAVVLVVSSRFGAAATVKTDPGADQDAFSLAESADGMLSITQAEALRSMEDGIPLFSFVYRPVLQEYRVFRANRENQVATKIFYPSIEDQGSAQFVFEFIAYLKTRKHGNAIHPFDRLEDILFHLKAQWAGLFQEHLRQLRQGDGGGGRLEELAESVKDLQSAVLVSAPEKQRATARAALRFRRLMDLVRGLLVLGEAIDRSVVSSCEERLLSLFFEAGVRVIYTPGDGAGGYLRRVFLKTVSNRIYGLGLSRAFLRTLENDWDEFIQIGEMREIVYAAHVDSNAGAPHAMLTPIDGADLRRLPQRFVSADTSTSKIKEMSDGSDEGSGEAFADPSGAISGWYSVVDVRGDGVTIGEESGTGMT